VVISKPQDSVIVESGGSLDVEATAYSMTSDIAKIEVYVDSAFLSQAANNPYAGTVTLPSLSKGAHTLKVTAYDAAGRDGSSSITLIVGDVVTITEPANNSTHTGGVPLAISAVHQGGGNVVWGKVYANGVEIGELVSTGGGAYVYQWTPMLAGNYTLYVVIRIQGEGNIQSQNVAVKVT